MIDSGSWYAREAWPHDGHPYRSEHFVVYSDGAAPAARQATAEIAEDVWGDLLARFDVEEQDLIFPADRDRIDIYVYKDRYPERWGMRAYQAGLIAWSLDHDRRSTDRGDYVPVVEHELVHVLGTLLRGRDATIEPMVETWFSEGLAEAVAGGTSGGPVRGRDQLSDLLATHDGQNPVALRRDSQYDADNDFHYPMFQLAVEYLLDAEGGNRSLADVRDLFTEMADGTSFEEAFGLHMGTPLDRYEAEFFTLMDGYLPPYRNPLFSPLGIALLGLGFAAVGAGVLVISGRRTRRDATTLARIGFYGSTTLGGLLATFGAFGVIVMLGTAGNLYNSAETTGRHLVSWLLVLYFGLALMVLVFLQRRWKRESRLGYLGLPLVLLLFVLTLAVASALL